MTKSNDDLKAAADRLMNQTDLSEADVAEAMQIVDSVFCSTVVEYFKFKGVDTNQAIKISVGDTCYVTIHPPKYAGESKEGLH